MIIEIFFDTTQSRREESRVDQGSGGEERSEKENQLNNIKTENNQKNENKKRLKMAKKMMSITFLYKKICIC